MDMIIQHGGKEVVGSSYRVDISGEMEVYVFHWDDLRVAAARRASFDAEYGAE
jgi:hypothetical protein